MNSSIFYFFWKSLTDARHVYPSDIAMFPIHLPLEEELLNLLRPIIKDLMECYRHNSRRIVYGNAEVDQYDVAPCKPIMDGIDCILSKHYQFTDEELDFVLNYDIKYRMGSDGEAENQ
jgi:hypothetical protein